MSSFQSFYIIVSYRILDCWHNVFIYKYITIFILSFGFRTRQRQNWATLNWIVCVYIYIYIYNYILLLLYEMILALNFGNAEEEEEALNFIYMSRTELKWPWVSIQYLKGIFKNRHTENEILMVHEKSSKCPIWQCVCLTIPPNPSNFTGFIFAKCLCYFF